MTKRKNERKINYPFTYTHHSPEMLLQQYIDDMNSFNNVKLKSVVEYIKGLPYFEQTIFLLYCEYSSLRQVAEETNTHYTFIFQIIKEIKKVINNLLKN